MGMFIHKFEDDRSWVDDAACKGMDIKLFFPDELRSGTGKTAQQARAVCARCTVRQQCQQYSVDEEYGIWGGMSARERILDRRARNLAIRNAS